jgi:uncharacterized protein (AIM24 family)
MHGIAKGGLSSGVVFLTELEGDGVSWLSSDVVGLEREKYPDRRR